MTASWYVVKFVPDLFRNEPVNVGVVVTKENEAATKFIGQRQDGSIDGRRVKPRIDGMDTYKAWVSFVQRIAKAGDLDERIEKLARRGFDSYIIERRGPVLNEDEAFSVKDAADEIFSALVATESVATSVPVDVAAEDVFSRLQFPPGNDIERNVPYTVRAKEGALREIQFDYRYTNGHVTLMEAMSFNRHGKSLSQSINDLLFRIEKVEAQQDVHNFIVLYGGDNQSSDVDRQLNVVNKYAETVNVSDGDAPQTVGVILGVPTRSKGVADGEDSSS